MASILERLKKNSTLELTSTISESAVLLDGFDVPTSIPVMNIALTGSLKSGLRSGITIFAGESKHFKSMYSLFLVSAYMKQYPESACLFYDSEFGTPMSYFEKMGIDPDRVIHTPITDMEQLKHDLMVQMEEVKRGDRLIILIDSLGNLASRKEVEDALDGKSVADMTRAKVLKSIMRQITPVLSVKDIPLVAINHVMDQIGQAYPTKIQSGGKSMTYAPNAVFFIGREQVKNGTEVVGYKFSLNVEKSRLVREKTKLPIEVSFEEGINKFSSLLDIALELGLVIAPTKGWYSRVIEGVVEEKKWRRKDTDNNEFWDVLLNDPEFEAGINKLYRLE